MKLVIKLNTLFCFSFSKIHKQYCIAIYGICLSLVLVVMNWQDVITGGTELRKMKTVKGQTIAEERKVVKM